MDVCLLSFILEGNVRNEVSGIRVVIIHSSVPHTSQSLEVPIIRECPNTWAIFRPPGIPVPDPNMDPREVHYKAYNRAFSRGAHRLTRERIKARGLPSTSSSLEKSPGHLPTLQIALSLIPVNPNAEKLANGFPDHCPPQYILELHTTKLGPSSPKYPILFDKTYQTCPSDQSLSLVLESIHPFVSPDWMGETADHKPEAVLGFTFHIFPLPSIPRSLSSTSTPSVACAHPATIAPTAPLASPITQLPPHHLLSIIRLTVPLPPFYGTSYTKPYWQDTIRSCALVCKSWAFLVRVYFEYAGTESYPVYDIIPYVGSLKAQPRMGEEVRTFDEAGLLGVYKQMWVIPDEDPLPLHLVEGCREVLKLAPLIKQVQVDQRLLSMILDEMATLEMVEEFKVEDLPWGGERERALVGFEEVYGMVCGWKKLKRFVIYTGLLETRPSADAIQLPPAPFSLTALSLTRGTYTLSQIRPLLASSITSGSLTRLELTSIRGLSNADLLHILSPVSHTLESLTIHDCFCRKSDQTEEEAFDVILPQAPNLQKVEIDADNTSVACIARKRSRGFTRTEPNAQIDVTFVSICLSWGIHDLRESIEKTAWTSILLDILPGPGDDGQPPPYSREEIRELRRVAEGRGIQLVIVLPPRMQ